MAYEVVMLYHFHMPSCFLGTFTEYPYQRGKLGRMGQTVLEKEPKVQSTAIKQMRHKAKELLKKVPEN